MYDCLLDATARAVPDPGWRAEVVDVARWSAARDGRLGRLRELGGVAVFGLRLRSVRATDGRPATAWRQGAVLGAALLLAIALADPANTPAALATAAALVLAVDGRPGPAALTTAVALALTLPSPWTPTVAALTLATLVLPLTAIRPTPTPAGAGSTAARAIAEAPAAARNHMPSPVPTPAGAGSTVEHRRRPGVRGAGHAIASALAAVRSNSRGSKPTPAGAGSTVEHRRRDRVLAAVRSAERIAVPGGRMWWMLLPVAVVGGAGAGPGVVAVGATLVLPVVLVALGGADPRLAVAAVVAWSWRFLAIDPDDLLDALAALRDPALPSLLLRLAAMAWALGLAIAVAHRSTRRATAL